MGGDEAKRPGRRAFSPTPEQRALVREALGETHEAIARRLGVSLPTLRKHFAEDLAARRPAGLFEAPPPRPAGHAGGRPPRAVSPEQRADVTTWASMGMSADDIGRVLGMSAPTVRKHFADELATAAARIEARMMTSLRRAADRGSVPAQREVLARIEAARLARLRDSLDAPQHDTAQPETPGKKALAQQEARAALDSTDWGQLIAARPN